MDPTKLFIQIEQLQPSKGFQLLEIFIKGNLDVQREHTSKGTSINQKEYIFPQAMTSVFFEKKNCVGKIIENL